MTLFALLTLYQTDPETGRTIVHAMPVLLCALLILAIAYRYYSAFLAAKVAVLDDSRVTPAVLLNDGQNYHPANKWVLFGHHFAAISGAGPLIGPVLAIQYGFMPGLLWLVIGVCLAGAVQDMLVLVASVRTEGKSIAEIAKRELGKPAAILASIAILFIVIIALAGLGMVVKKALGGEEAALPAGTEVKVPWQMFHCPPGSRCESPGLWVTQKDGAPMFHFARGCDVRYPENGEFTHRSEEFDIRGVKGIAVKRTDTNTVTLSEETFPPDRSGKTDITYILPPGSSQVIPGSSWGTFTLACTVPIAILIGLLMKSSKKFGVVGASILGAVLTLAAVVVGGWIPGSPLEKFFSLTEGQTVLALCVYGFIAAVLPVWLLLGPRDYLSSFLKIGTVALLIGSVCIANPPLKAPTFNEVFMNGSPTFPSGGVFPFVFICVMCGAVSGFHSLVSSGTTPKMVTKESHIRTIGYGAMLLEGTVGITALIAAAALPNELYYDINISLEQSQKYDPQVKQVYEKYGRDPLHNANVDGPSHLDLGTMEQKVGGESLRGRTGGAVTLAVGMSVIFEDAFKWIGVTGDWLLKYWYHFAIMFEALFILTTIDAGTRIGRFLLQETLGQVYKPFARADWLPGSLLASAVITGSWGLLIYTGSVDTIWPMFGVANQSLAVLALAIVTTWLVNRGKGKWAFVTILPMLWVISTTLTAATNLVTISFPNMMTTAQGLIDSGKEFRGKTLKTTAILSSAMTLFVVASVGSLVLWCAAKWVSVWRKR